MVAVLLQIAELEIKDQILFFLQLHQQVVATEQTHLMEALVVLVVEQEIMGLDIPEALVHLVKGIMVVALHMAAQHMVVVAAAALEVLDHKELHQQVEMVVVVQHGLMDLHMLVEVGVDLMVLELQELVDLAVAEMAARQVLELLELPILAAVAAEHLLTQQVLAMRLALVDLVLSLFVIQVLKWEQAVLLPAAADIPIIHSHHRGHTQHELSWHTPIWQYDPHGHEHHGH